MKDDKLIAHASQHLTSVGFCNAFMAIVVLIQITSRTLFNEGRL
jgi:TRAP-type C4-dicarboxylate transport system permease small subunit